MKIAACSTCSDPCCARTTYKLTNGDIDRLLEVTRGDALRDATIRNPDGTIQFKEPCQYHVNNRCIVYKHRPLGCRIYPIVYNNRVTVDPFCPGHAEIQYPERKSIIVEDYMMRIQREARERIA